MRYLTLLVILLSVACSSNEPGTGVPAQKMLETIGEAPDFSDPAEQVYNVALLIMDGTYNTELTAPYDIFQHTVFRKGIRSMQTFTVAATRDVVTTFEGMRILPDLVVK